MQNRLLQINTALPCRSLLKCLIRLTRHYPTLMLSRLDNASLLGCIGYHAATSTYVTDSVTAVCVAEAMRSAAAP